MKSPTKMRVPPVFLFVLVAVLAVSACGQQASGGGEEQVVQIGYTGPLSGGAALYGENVLTGMSMAVDDINEAGIEIGGTPARFEIESLDDTYLPNESATNSQRLVQQQETPVVLIPHSGGIFAAQQINNSRDQFLIAAYSSDPAIVEQDNPLTTMIPPRFDNYMQPFTELMMENFGNRLGLIPTQSEYGQEWTRYITEAWESQGGEVLTNNGVDYSTTSDFASVMSQALAEDPDVLFIGGPSQPTALVVEEARNRGFEGGFIVMDQAKFEEMEQFTSIENLNGSVGVKPVVANEGAAVDRFVERWENEITAERPPVSEVAYNYQAVHLIAKAMEIAGTADDPQAIRDSIDEAIPEVDEEYKIVNFPERITEEGHLAGPVTASVVQDGEYTDLEVPQQH
jgi:branched-chain amino acid transport system substrate-binding protein